MIIGGGVWSLYSIYKKIRKGSKINVLRDDNTAMSLAIVACGLILKEPK
jgi:hypothetical protein